MDTKYIDVLEAAECLSVSTQVIRKHIKAGDLPAYRFGGKVLLKVSDVESFIQPYLPTGEDSVA